MYGSRFSCIDWSMIHDYAAAFLQLVCKLLGNKLVSTKFVPRTVQCGRLSSSPCRTVGTEQLTTRNGENVTRSLMRSMYLPVAGYHKALPSQIYQSRLRLGLVVYILCIDLMSDLDHGTISCMVSGQGGIVAPVSQRSYPDLCLEDLHQVRSKLPADSAGCAEYLARQHEIVILCMNRFMNIS